MSQGLFLSELHRTMEKIECVSNAMLPKRQRLVRLHNRTKLYDGAGRQTVFSAWDHVLWYFLKDRRS